MAGGYPVRIINNGTDYDLSAVSSVQLQDSLVVTASATATGVIFSQDMTGYGGVSIYFDYTSATGVTLVAEVSDNNVFWNNAPGITADITSGPTPQFTIASTSVRLFPKMGRYFRLRLTALGSGTVNITAVFTSSSPVTYGAIAAYGQAAHGSSIALSPVRIGARARTSAITALANDQQSDAIATPGGALITKPYAVDGADWQYAAASGGITNTTGVTVKTAAGASVRNYVTGIQLANGSATATDVQIRDGAAGTVLWRAYAPANMPLTNITFPTPLKGTANTLVEVACGTTGSAIYVNVQGFVAP